MQPPSTRISAVLEFAARLPALQDLSESLSRFKFHYHFLHSILNMAKMHAKICSLDFTFAIAILWHCVLAWHSVTEVLLLCCPIRCAARIWTRKTWSNQWLYHVFFSLPSQSPTKEPDTKVIYYRARKRQNRTFKTQYAALNMHKNFISQSTMLTASYDMMQTRYCILNSNKN